jgi:uncharacterized protein with HEPN domain
METDQLGRLRDILEAARLIGSYVRGTTEAEFQAKKEKQDAVIRRIEIIGEAAAHLTEATRRVVPELDFRKMRGMRNIVAHDYANVNLHIVWEVAPLSMCETFAPCWKSFSPAKHERTTARPSTSWAPASLPAVTPLPFALKNAICFTSVARYRVI